LLLTIGCFPAAQGIKLQQLTLFVCGLIAGCAALVVGDQLVLAGVLLAAATIKPQLVVLLIPWLTLWVFSEWHARKRLVLGAGFTMLLLFLGAQLILPGWIARFLDALIAYREYTGGGGSVLDALTFRTLGNPLALALVCLLVFVCWKTRHAPADSDEFSWTMALVLAVTVTVIPMTAPYNQLLLLPAVYLLVRENGLVPRRNWVARMLCWIGTLIIIWPWLATAGLFLSSSIFPPSTVQRAWAAPLYTSFAIPPATIALLMPNILKIVRGSSKPCNLA
jgi:hypothetical protein